MFATIVVAIAKTVAMMAMSYLVSTILAPKPNNAAPESASAQDFDFPQAEEGTPQCVFFGDTWTQDWQVLAYGNFVSTPIRRG